MFSAKLFKQEFSARPSMWTNGPAGQEHPGKATTQDAQLYEWLTTLWRQNGSMPFQPHAQPPPAVQWVVTSADKRHVREECSFQHPSINGP